MSTDTHSATFDTLHRLLRERVLTLDGAMGPMNRTLSGQTLDAFYVSIRHARPLSIGINCALGARDMRPYIAELAQMAECYISVSPNAGLPNAFGQYDELPDETGPLLRDFVARGFANIVGGCCGTTPDHIAAVRRAVEGLEPRPLPARAWLPPSGGRTSPGAESNAPGILPAETGSHETSILFTQFSGRETLTIHPDSNFQMIGERTNVTGSAKFARLIESGNYAEAAHVAAEQVRGGANLIDVNMDEGMLDSEQAMTTFLNYIATEPEIARVPVMVDSSKWSVIEAGLKCVQGKGVVNSISLKEGQADFLHKAKLIQRYGAGVVVMAFDEAGQADTIQRRAEICQRAYKLLVGQAGLNPSDIIFDPNILPIATGLEEHNDYAVNFIEATRIIKATCPGVKVSGGVSNLSFSFRGNDVVREAMHSAFLFHAIKAGMDMGIVNAGQLIVYEDIDKTLLEHVEDVIFNRRPDATDRLVQFADLVKGSWRGRRESRRPCAACSSSRRQSTAAAVTIAPEYAGPVVHAYEKARANRQRFDWDDHEISSPWFLGRRYLDNVPLEEIAKYIDWTFFFSAWGLKGRYPAILTHMQYGAAARELFDNAQALLRRIIDEKLLTARGTYGFWPANSAGDDVVLYTDDSRRVELARFPMLRQQEIIAGEKPNRSLADFVAPRESGVPDYLGLFAVTAGIGADELVRQFEADHDDYHAIMVKAIADRLAEAFAEYLHAQARKDWGYGESERLTNDDLIAEKYRGIRPAYGYPACPDHSEKFKLFELLDATRQGITLTESGAMLPAASVSGLYFSHPQAKYFTVGRIDRDQLESYAKRKGVQVEEVERWLASNLAYDPAALPGKY